MQTADGSEGYTRNGSIQVDPHRALTIQGHPVVGEAGPIAVPEGAEITIAADGNNLGAESGRSGKYGCASGASEAGESHGQRSPAR